MVVMVDDCREAEGGGGVGGGGCEWGVIVVVCGY